MEAKHTPGPWAANKEFANRWSIEAPSPNGEGFVPLSIGNACTTILQVGCDDRDTEANAKLIAAAPDLLAALNGMLLHIREPDSEAEFQWPDHFKRQKDAFAAARAAIAKATA